MFGILDRVASSVTPKNQQFRPASPEEFFALQLAHRLGEPAAVRHYVDVVKSHSIAQVLKALRRVRRTDTTRSLARCFHEEMERLGSREFSTFKERRLAAFRVQRRSVAAVIFLGDRLEYPPLVRQLPSEPTKSQHSAARFVSSVMQKCPFRTAALETVPSVDQTQRLVLTELIKQVLSEEAVGIWQVNKTDMLAAFGYPPPKHRIEVHSVITGIWPDMVSREMAPLVRDALALGLYCQTEYLFNL